jgi:hypothetical protein
MKNWRKSSYTVVFALSAAVMVGCGGAEAESPPPTLPPPAPAEPATPPAAATPPAEAAKAPEPAKKEEPPPPPAPKPLKERLVGVWQPDFSGEVKTAAEADAQKKAGKDEKKLADLMKKAEEAHGKNKIETTGDTLVLWEGDKTVSKAKYEIVKEDAATNTIVVKRVGKDEVSKKDAPAAEISITFKDDNTVEIRDLKEKDAKKAKLITYKKVSMSASAGATPATPATPANDKTAGKGATPATPATPAKK